MNILLTSAGRRGYLVQYFREALEPLGGKVFASNSEYTIALQKADGYFISPLIYDSKYIESIVEFCKKNAITAVISLFDIDLLVLSRAENIFKLNGIQLLLASAESVELCNDKWMTNKALEAIGVKAPRTYKSLADFNKAKKDGQIDYPIIIKPRWGMASMGIYIVYNKEELRVMHRRCLREIGESYLKYESGLTPGEEILFQELLDGVEYGVDVINDLTGSYVCNLPKSKLRMRAGETDLGQSVDPGKFEGIAKELSKLIKHKAILSVDCFEVNGDLIVTELNCRISGHYPLSHLSGANLPKQIVEWLEGKPTDMRNFNYKVGTLVTKDLTPVVLDSTRRND